MAMDAPNDRRALVQSVTRAFSVLNILRDGHSPMSVQELARVAGLDRTVVHRLVRSLHQERMVVEERGLYRLGSASVLLANRYIDDLLVRRLALPYMIELQDNDLAGTPWTATLSIPVGDASAVIERIWTPTTPLDLVLGVGDTFPIGMTATGRSMLAYYDQHALDAVVDAEQQDTLAPVLAEIRDAGGVGLVKGEAVPGVEAVAAVVLSRRRVPIAAISVSGVDLGDQLDYRSALAATLRRAAGAIGQMIP